MGRQPTPKQVLVRVFREQVFLMRRLGNGFVLSRPVPLRSSLSSMVPWFHGPDRGYGTRRKWKGIPVRRPIIAEFLTPCSPSRIDNMPTLILRAFTWQFGQNRLVGARTHLNHTDTSFPRDTDIPPPLPTPRKSIRVTVRRESVECRLYAICGNI